jgi:hypothetical protein
MTSYALGDKGTKTITVIAAGYFYYTYAVWVATPWTVWAGVNGLTSGLFLFGLSNLRIMGNNSACCLTVLPDGERARIVMLNG